MFSEDFADAVAFVRVGHLDNGRVYGGGKVVKLFVSNIRRELYDKILEAAGLLAGGEPAAEKQNALEQASEDTQTKSETDAAMAEVLHFTGNVGPASHWEEIS